MSKANIALAGCDKRGKMGRQRNHLAPRNPVLHRLSRDYTTVLVLALLCGVLSALTWSRQYPSGAAGGKQLAALLERELPRGTAVLIVVRNTTEDAAFAAAAAERLTAAGYRVVETVRGQPADARRAIERAVASRTRIDAIACNDVTANWGVFGDLPSRGAAVESARVLFPASYYWPTFLKLDNLLNIANQIALIAIIAIGMTMVIVAGGIDLSVGSLVALAAVACARLIRDLGSGVGAGPAAVAASMAAAVALCGAVGGINGFLAAVVRIPPFIVTLAMMSIASGVAFIVAEGDTINDVPPGIERLMRGSHLGVPNAVVLMLLLYAGADIVMKRTKFGRYLYAVGGNLRAAWLCGVPVRRVVLLSYVVSGALAGLAGVLMVSQYQSGGPKYGATYELQVIAAVVVGGTSLSGGQGKMFGTLLGALLIAVVNNGMNLLGIGSYPQMVVLGLVILGAALLDRLKQRKEETG
jgi:ribose transport system permease protein